jgi:hypothetical protein
MVFGIDIVGIEGIGCQLKFWVSISAAEMALHAAVVLGAMSVAD